MRISENQPQGVTIGRMKGTFVSNLKGYLQVLMDRN